MPEKGQKTAIVIGKPIDNLEKMNGAHSKQEPA